MSIVERGLSRMGRLGALFAEARLRRPRDFAFSAWRALAARTGLLALRFPRDRADAALLRAAMTGRPPREPSALVAAIESATEGRFPGMAAEALLAACDRSPDPARWRRLVQAEADAAMGGELSIFGHAYRLSRPIRWRRDPRTGTEWPPVHWTRTRRSPGAGVDVKDCWELSRHGHFFALAQKWGWTKDERCAKTFSEDIQSWADQNPPETGIHYMSNLELGLRALAWLAADAAFRDSTVYDTQARLTLHANVYAMGRHIARNLIYTRFRGPNNHLVGDAAALLVIANRYPIWRRSSAWRCKARAVLWRTLRRQVLADGIHFERSFGYHAFVLEFAAAAIASERAAGGAIPRDIVDRIGLMIDVIVASRQPDGTLPNVNDCDDGRVFPLVSDEALRLSWLTGWATELCGSLPTSIAESRAAERDVRIFPDAGWVIGRSQDQWWMLDNHDDPFPDSGHNHASLLQLTCWIDGKPLLVDSGTYRYNGDAELRNRLRASAAHNTVVVDGRSQAEPVRAFGWRSRARPQALRVTEQSDHVVAWGRHAAYSTRACSIVHERSVVWLPTVRTWVVLDRVWSQRPVMLWQLWHLHPSRTPELRPDGAVALSADGKVMLSAVGPEPSPSLELGRSGSEAWATPYSPSYGQLADKCVLRRRMRCDGALASWTVIRDVRAAGTAPPTLTLEGALLVADWAAVPREAGVHVEAR